MNDEEREPREPEEDEPRDEEQDQDEDVDLLKEVSLLGQHLGGALREVWDSDERRKIEKEFVKGLYTARKEVQSLADEVRRGKATQPLKEGAEKVTQDVRQGILGGLRRINKELNRVRRERRGRDEE